MTQQARPEALLERVSKHDASALGELYDQLAPHLFPVLLRILADRAAAEDVLGHAFVELSREARRLRREPASVSAWLMMTARAVALDRRRGRRESRLDGTRSLPLEQSASALPSSAEIARLEERRELLRKVLARLPAAQRRGLELLVFEGYTESEIAREFGEPLGRARTGLRASLAFLRHRLRAVLGTWAANI